MLLEERRRTRAKLHCFPNSLIDSFALTVSGRMISSALTCCNSSFSQVLLDSIEKKAEPRSL